MADSTAQAGTNTQATEPTQGNEGRTFTQAELDKIVQNRVYEERKKLADYDDLKAKADELDQLKEANNTELQEAQDRAAKAEKDLADLKAAEALRESRAKVSAETGVPSELLTGENEEACKEQAKKILEFAKTKGYPTVRDGGEVKNVGKPSTAQQFAEWAKENL